MTKWCRYSVNGRTAYGIVQGNDILEVEGSPFGQYSMTPNRRPLASVKLEVPVIPNTFYCVGFNYADHIVSQAAKKGIQPVFPERPEISYRANSALIPHGESIVKPRDASEKFQYEGELVAVIGQKAKNVSKDDALKYVFGWTIGNDVSERTWQSSDRSLWRAKNSDTFKPMGPFIETDPPPFESLITTVRINDQEVDKFRTSKMIFDVSAYISEITKYITLYPGDVIWMGTDGSPRNMVPGDVVEIEITGIGKLRNPVTAE